MTIEVQTVKASILKLIAIAKQQQETAWEANKKAVDDYNEANENNLIDERTEAQERMQTASALFETNAARAGILRMLADELSIDLEEEAQ